MLSDENPNSTHEYSWEIFCFLFTVFIFLLQEELVTSSNIPNSIFTLCVSSPKKINCNQSGHAWYQR